MEGANLDLAEQLYEEAAQLFEQEKAQRGQAHIYLRRSYLNWLEENFEDSYQEASQAVTRFEQSGDKLGLAHAKTFQLLNDLAQGRLQDATELAEEVGAWGRASGAFSYVLGLGILISRVARHWLIRKADFEKALSTYRVAKVFFKNLDAPVNIAQVSADEGKTYELMSEFDQALVAYEAAADGFEAAIHRHPIIAADLHRLGVMLVQSHYNLALKMMDGHSVARSAQKLEALQAANLNLATSDNMAADLGMDAMIAQLSYSVLSQASVFSPLYKAVKARNEGDTQGADVLFAEALKQAEAQPNNAFLMATVFGQQRKYPEAKAYFDQYLSASMAGQGLLGDALKMLEMYGGEQAQQQINKQKSRHLEQALTFMVRTKHFLEAKNYASELESMLGKEWYLQTEQAWLLLSDYGELYEGLGDISLKASDTRSALDYWSKSIQFFEQGIDLLEAQRNRLSRDELKTALGGGLGVQYLYFSSARVCVKICQLYREKEDEVSARTYLEQSFEVTEKNKSKALLDLLEDSQQLQRVSQEENESITSWREKSAMVSLYKGMLAYEHRSSSSNPLRIQELEEKISKLEDERQSLEVKIQQESPDFYAMLNEEASTLSMQELIDQLPAQTTVLQYYFLGQDLLIWAINSEGAAQAFHRSYDAQLLNQEASNFHKLCQERGVWESASQSLSEILLTPLEEEVFGKATKLLIYSTCWLTPHTIRSTVSFESIVIGSI